MNFIQTALGNIAAAGQGFIEGLTGASQRKKEVAKRKQKEASAARQEARRHVATASQEVRRLLAKARDTDRRQDATISSAAKLAQRSMSTAKSLTFESQALRGLVSGVRKDLKVLASTSASAQALKETNETLGDLAEQVKEMSEATKAYRENTDKSLQALNEEAADTTAHLDALTLAANEKGDWEKLATDILPWARVAVQALNVEKPTNEVAYYAYLAAGPFLRERMDPAIAEVLTTGLQILAYWDEDGLKGLFQSRSMDRATARQLEELSGDVKALRGFLARADVAKALEAAKIEQP